MKNPEVRIVEGAVPAFDYNILESFKLSKTITPLKISLDTVIANRKSSHNFNKTTLQQLSDILWYVAKVKSTILQDDGYILTYRGTASAGARHPIDIVVYNPKLLSSSYLYYYNPFEHSLNKLAGSSSDITSFIGHIDEIVNTANATVLWFVAHKNRTRAKYKYADSLIYRDAGVLIHGFQMVCTALDLNCCPIGSLGEPFISNFFKNQTGVCGLGGILIG